MKLTSKQHALLVEMVIDCEPGTTVEFGAGEYEWRTATSLARRGLCEITGGRSEFGYFEAMATPAGRLALQGANRDPE